jgi:hypothetical protein
MNFGQALESLRRGHKLRRKSGTETVQLVTPESGHRVQTSKGNRDPIGTFIGVVWADGKTVHAWPALHADLLADDWEIMK